MKTKQLAYCAVMTALLIAVQYALSFVSGVELVTVFFMCFCYVFGIRCGILTAVAFSLLRCLLFGFMPNVLALYLIYYIIFAAVFGAAGKYGIPAWICPVLLTFMAAASAYFAVSGIPISALYKKRTGIMLWILSAIFVLLLAVYIFLTLKKRSAVGSELASVTALASFLTVAFTLLDDIITPLFLGFTAETAQAYFYAGFLSMLPQTICAAVSVFALFLPIKRTFAAVLNFGGDQKREI